VSANSPLLMLIEIFLRTYFSERWKRHLSEISEHSARLRYLKCRPCVRDMLRRKSRSEVLVKLFPFRN